MLNVEIKTWTRALGTANAFDKNQAIPSLWFQWNPSPGLVCRPVEILFSPWWVTFCQIWKLCVQWYDDLTGEHILPTTACTLHGAAIDPKQPSFPRADFSRDYVTLGHVHNGSFEEPFGTVHATLFTGRMPFMSPNQHCQSAERITLTHKALLKLNDSIISDNSNM